MATRYWVKRESDDNLAVPDYFDSEGMAEVVAESLEEEAGKEYYVDTKP